MTAEAWVRTSVDTGVRSVIERRGAFNLSLMYGRARAFLNLTNNNGFTTDHLELLGGTELHDGRWHHVAVTYDGTTARLFVDGQEDALAKGYQGRLQPAIGVDTTIGKGTTSSDLFVGDVDEVAIYDHAVPQSEIGERVGFRWTPTSACGRTTPYATTICAADPSGYWRLGEQSGTIAADHTGVRNARYETGVTFGRPGAIGESNTAISMDDTQNGFVSVSYEPYGTYATRKLTAETWFKTSRKDTMYRGIMHRPDAFYIAVYDGKILVKIYTEGSPSSVVLWGNNQVTDGLWHHVAFTVDGSTARLYVDGAQSAAAGMTGRLRLAPGKGISIGHGTILSPFVGTIDEPAIYSRPLVAADIQARWTFRE